MRGPTDVWSRTSACVAFGQNTPIAKIPNVPKYPKFTFELKCDSRIQQNELSRMNSAELYMRTILRRFNHFFKN